MDWKPSDGQNRADMVVRNFARDAEVAVGLVLPEILRWRLFDAVAKTIDQALADGAERDALNKMLEQALPPQLGNTLTEGIAASMAQDGFVTRANALGWNNGNGHADPDDYSELPTYKAAPVLFDRIDDPHVISADPGLMQDASPEQVAKLFEEAPKKRRGRPPGSKGAKAKKKAKAGKAAVVEAAPVPETVAPTVTEQSEAPA